MNSNRRIGKLAIATLAAAALGVSLAGCSSDALFPAVHDMPAARADTPMTPDQVKQATSDLVSQREHLSTEAQGVAQSAAATNAPAATGTLPPKKPAAAATNASPQKKPATAATNAPAAQPVDSAVSAYAKQ